MFLKNQSSLKKMGNVKNTFTGLPSIVPGFQRGIALTTRSASSSHSLSMPFIILQSVMLPSKSTTNFTTTRPSILCALALSGYCMFSLMYLFRSNVATGIWRPVSCTCLLFCPELCPLTLSANAVITINKKYLTEAF